MATFTIGIYVAGQLEGSVSREDLRYNDWRDPMVGTTREIVPDIEEAKTQGLRVGFGHGHHRMNTPGSIVHVLMAKERCDFLVWGIEAGWRSGAHKGELPNHKTMIAREFMLAGMVNRVIMIQRYAYSNEGYRRLVRTVGSDIYFGQAGKSEEYQVEMRYRADLIGARYVELPEVESFSTSEFLSHRSR